MYAKINDINLQDVPVVTIVEYPEMLTEGTIRVDLSDTYSESEHTGTSDPYSVCIYTDILLDGHGVVDSPVSIRD